MILAILSVVCFLTLLQCGEAQVTTPSTTASLPHLHYIEKLQKDLFKNYSSSVRPSQNKSSPLNIYIHFSLIRLNYLSLHWDKQDVSLWQYTTWNDVRLGWNPADYGGVSVTRVPSTKIWTPDIRVDNSVYGWKETSLAILYSSGHVVWDPVSRYGTHCDMDASRFPFDEQNCSLTFGSWAYAGDELDLSVAPWVDVSNFHNNRGWLLKNATVRRQVFYADCCPNIPYVDVIVSLVWKRHSTMHTHVLILPASFLACVLPFMFLLPPNSKHKLTLGIVIIVILELLHQELMWFIPSSAAKPPIVAVYYMLILGLAAVGIVLSVIVISLVDRGPRFNRVPLLMRKIVIQGLKPLVFLGGIVTPDELDTGMKGIDNPAIGGLGLAESQDEGINAEQIVCEWRLVGLVIDRCMFAVYTVIIIVAGTGIFS